MSCDQSYPFPQVFLVDGSPQQTAQPPSLIPCWSFPPAHERVRSREKSRGCMGVSPSVALLVLFLFLLAFVALGFEAYQIHGLQEDMKDMREAVPVTEVSSAQQQKQISHYDPGRNGVGEVDRPAAHVTGRIERKVFPKTLRWDPRDVRAFTSGGVTYRFEDGALQVNQSGLYHIYSRVELTFKDCSPTSSFLHTVFSRKAGRPAPDTLMEAHRAGFCSHRLEHSWTTESYLASAVQLEKYERVFVNVSHPSYLRHAHYANFFGLYKI